MSEHAGLEQTLPTLFLRSWQHRGNDVAMRKKEYGIWNEYKWNDCYQKIKLLSLGLVTMGLEPGDRVSILGDSNPEWYWAELAVMAAQGVVTGIPPDSLPAEVKYVVEHSQSKFVVTQDQEQVDKLLKVRDGLPLVQKIIYWDDEGLWNNTDTALIGFDEVMAMGSRLKGDNSQVFENSVSRGKADDLCIIMYTSGTTSQPKGAMMTHRSLLAGANATMSANPVYHGDEFVCHFAPGSIGEQGLGLVPFLIAGETLNFPEKTESAQEDIREIAPHVLLFPSPLWEQIAATMRSNIADSRLKNFLFELCLPIGYKVADMSLRGKKVGLLWRFLRAMTEFIIFRPLKDRHGLVRVRVPYTGGFTVSPEIIRFFRAIGFNLRQVFGSTEGNIVAAHTADDFKFESVGRIVLGMCMRISDDGEILIHRDNCFKGYYRDAEATARVFRGEWYHSGDAGHIDDDGHLIFIDRLADMRLLSNGTKFSPQYLESRLRSSLYIKNAIALGGENRSFIAAIININFDNVGHWAERKRIPYTTFADLSQKTEVLELIREEIEVLNGTLPPNSKIRRFVSLPKELDPDDAELTRSRKLRRNFMEDRYTELAEAIYSDNEEVSMETRVVYTDGRSGIVSTKIKIVRLQ